MSGWPMVALGDVLRHRKQFIEIDDFQTYKRCRVQLHAQGIVLRDAVVGAEIKTKKQQVCRAGDFLVAEIDAKVGGYGIVPENLEGAVVSSHYFLFEVCEEALDRRFLGYYVRTPGFHGQVAAQGSTNYAAIRPNDVLAYRIPLPPITEQRRLVERIEALAGKIEEANQLQTQAAEGRDRLLIAMAHRDDLDASSKTAQGWQQVSLGEVLKRASAPHDVSADQNYPNLGIYSFGRGLFKKQPIEGMATNAKMLFRVTAGQFIYSRLFAFEGAYGRVTQEFDGYFVSNEYPTFDCDAGRVQPAFLAAYFKAPRVWADVAIGSKGLGDRRQRVHPEQILGHRLFLPPLEWQRRIAKVEENLLTVGGAECDISAELTALLPSVLDRAFKGEL